MSNENSDRGLRDEMIHLAASTENAQLKEALLDLLEKNAGGHEYHPSWEEFSGLLGESSKMMREMQQTYRLLERMQKGLPQTAYRDMGKLLDGFVTLFARAKSAELSLWRND